MFVRENCIEIAVEYDAECYIIYATVKKQGGMWCTEASSFMQAIGSSSVDDTIVSSINGCDAISNSLKDILCIRSCSIRQDHADGGDTLRSTILLGSFFKS